MENKVFDARQEGILGICRPLRGLSFIVCALSPGACAPGFMLTRASRTVRSLPQRVWDSNARYKCGVVASRTNDRPFSIVHFPFLISNLALPKLNPRYRHAQLS